jgi:hypothetical protein
MVLVSFIIPALVPMGTEPGALSFLNIFLGSRLYHCYMLGPSIHTSGGTTLQYARLQSCSNSTGL